MPYFELHEKEENPGEIKIHADTLEELHNARSDVTALTDSELVALWYGFSFQFPEGAMREGIDFADVATEAQAREHLTVAPGETRIKNTDGKYLVPNAVDLDE
jgi:hypothetical protein